MDGAYAPQLMADWYQETSRERRICIKGANIDNCNASWFMMRRKKNTRCRLSIIIRVGPRP
jgi:hypothetical protein